jgi:hypothetical protein
VIWIFLARRYSLICDLDLCSKEIYNLSLRCKWKLIYIIQSDFSAGCQKVSQTNFSLNWDNHTCMCWITQLDLVWNLSFYKTKVFQCLAKQYFSFAPFSVLEKRGSDLFLQYLKNTTVLKLLVHYLLHPNTLKYLILQYFQKLKYSLNTSKKYFDAKRGLNGLWVRITTRCILMLLQFCADA